MPSLTRFPLGPGEQPEAEGHEQALRDQPDHGAAAGRRWARQGAPEWDPGLSPPQPCWTLSCLPGARSAWQGSDCSSLRPSLAGVCGNAAAGGLHGQGHPGDQGKARALRQDPAEQGACGPGSAPSRHAGLCPSLCKAPWARSSALTWSPAVPADVGVGSCHPERQMQGLPLQTSLEKCPRVVIPPSPCC